MEVSDLFLRASRAAYRYGITLPGEMEACPGVPPLDLRLTDSEFVIHELAHAVLLEMDLTDQLEVQVEKRLESLSKDYAVNNELQAASVTLAVLRAYKLSGQVLAAYKMSGAQGPAMCSLVPRDPADGWVEFYISTFAATVVGKAATKRVRQILEAEVGRQDP